MLNFGFPKIRRVPWAEKSCVLEIVFNVESLRFWLVLFLCFRDSPKFSLWEPLLYDLKQCSPIPNLAKKNNTTSSHKSLDSFIPMLPLSSAEVSVRRCVNVDDAEWRTSTHLCTVDDSCVDTRPLSLYYYRPSVPQNSLSFFFSLSTVSSFGQGTMDNATNDGQLTTISQMMQCSRDGEDFCCHRWWHDNTVKPLSLLLRLLPDSDPGLKMSDQVSADPTAIEPMLYCLCNNEILQVARKYFIRLILITRSVQDLTFP